MTRQNLPTRVRRRLGRELERAGKRLAQPSLLPARQPPATGGAAAKPVTPARTQQWPETIDMALYEPDPDPERAAAILQGAFGHGYLVQTGGPAELPGFLAQWAVRRVGPLWLHTAPRTVLTVAESESAGAAVILFGHPVDIDGDTVDAQVIADRLLGLLTTSGSESMVRAAAYLAGRWTLIALLGDDVVVVPDMMATHPVFYASDDASATLASSEILVGLARQLQPSRHVREVMARARAVRRSGVIYTPGLLTMIEDVLPLIPNCLLRLRLTAPGEIVHERFWPWEPRVEDDDLERVHAAFSDRMRSHLRLLSQLGPLSWSLTAGRDSRVSLAHLDQPAPAGTSAFTYLNPRDIARSADVADDLFVSNALATRLGLHHRVLRWRQAAPGTVFDRLHRATYPLRSASQGAAHAMWADLPRDIIQVQSMGGEVGTVYPRVRTDEPLGPGMLAVQWLGKVARGEEAFLSVFSDYQRHAQFYESRLMGHNPHDLFYWEHRMGRWGSRKMLDGDFGHTIMVAYQDRTLIEIMHRLPEADRISKVLYDRVLRDRPELNVETG